MIELISAIASPIVSANLLPGPAGTIVVANDGLVPLTLQIGNTFGELVQHSVEPYTRNRIISSTNYPQLITLLASAKEATPFRVWWSPSEDFDVVEPSLEPTKTYNLILGPPTLTDTAILRPVVPVPPVLNHVLS